MQKNKFIIVLISNLCVLVISLFAFIPLETPKCDGINWMAKVSDNATITSLSIPGSHDSGALHSIADVSGKCQDLSITSQLNIGIRFFDIRLKLNNNELEVVHSFVKQKLSFNSVMKDFYNFIKENPSETLIISIKKDDDSVNSTFSFEDATNTALNEYSGVVDFSNSLPNQLKDARGKIYILARYDTEIGIPSYLGWQDSTTFTIDNLYIQDNYAVKNTDEKISDIINTFNYSDANQNILTLNFTSCYLEDAFPPTYAGTSANTINPWLIRYLKEHQDLHLGIIISDFVTAELAELIYGRNF